MAVAQDDLLIQKDVCVIHRNVQSYARGRGCDILELLFYESNYVP